MRIALFVRVAASCSKLPDRAEVAVTPAAERIISAVRSASATAPQVAAASSRSGGMCPRELLHAVDTAPLPLERPRQRRPL
ncbi:unnamed protein product [Lampetra planeri]